MVAATSSTSSATAASTTDDDDGENHHDVIREVVAAAVESEGDGASGACASGFSGACAPVACGSRVLAVATSSSSMASCAEDTTQSVEKTESSCLGGGGGGGDDADDYDDDYDDPEGFHYIESEGVSLLIYRSLFRSMASVSKSRTTSCYMLQFPENRSMVNIVIHYGVICPRELYRMKAPCSSVFRCESLYAFLGPTQLSQKR
ncbi:hypothetical protein ANN_02506 [Periplaneta americana]|uniref:Uncharacterized protein n=1 Tax=Periplaneta americana TaxID=6978 RepID=A0ABQ8TZY0_PERAM|nr:hypothetical protein ANN_02506 [Periplaneta americana]